MPPRSGVGPDVAVHRVRGGGVELTRTGVGQAVLVAAFAMLGVADRLVRSVWMEYRIGPDVIGHDRLLGGDLWRVPGRTVRRCEPQRTVADRLFGTVTYRVEHDGETYRLPHVPEDCVTGLEPTASSAEFRE